MPVPELRAARHDGLAYRVVVNLTTGRKVLTPGAALWVAATDGFPKEARLYA